MIIITDFFVALEIRGKKYNYYTSSILKYFEEYENVVETIFCYRIRTTSDFPSIAYKKIKGVLINLKLSRDNMWSVFS